MSNAHMSHARLETIYRAYIACLNRQDWSALGQYVADDAIHNGRPIGLVGYRRMLEQDFRDIPDLHFTIELVVAGEKHIASRLTFDCSPMGQFLGITVNGRRVSFAENVFYEFRNDKIVRVWSIIDKAAIEEQVKN